MRALFSFRFRPTLIHLSASGNTPKRRANQAAFTERCKCLCNLTTAGTKRYAPYPPESVPLRSTSDRCRTIWDAPQFLMSSVYYVNRVKHFQKFVKKNFNNNLFQGWSNFRLKNGPTGRFQHFSESEDSACGVNRATSGQDGEDHANSGNSGAA